MNELLQGQDVDRQANELRKVLILAGMKVEMELQDKDTVQMISDILEKFDPKETIEEDEALFCARMG